MPKLTFDYETLKLQFDAEVNLWELTHNHFIVWRGLGEALSEGQRTYGAGCEIQHPDSKDIFAYGAKAIQQENRST